MAVLSSVGVAVAMFVLNMVMLVRGVRVSMGDVTVFVFVFVFVGVGRVVGVLLGHRCISLVQLRCADSFFTGCRCAADSAGALIR